MFEKRLIKITDLAFRDGHQSFFATRMNRKDMLTWKASKF